MTQDPKRHTSHQTAQDAPGTTITPWESSSLTHDGPRLRRAFVERLLAALAKVGAEPFTEIPHIWPTGHLLRVKVITPLSVSLPPALDPVGVVWYAERGEFRSVLDTLALAQQLVGESHALNLIAASDERRADTHEQHAWRLALEAALTRYFALRERPQ